MTWVMPAEWQPHERTWMAWMEEDYSKDSNPESADEMHRAWAKVANTIVNFEPVSMLVSLEHEAEARAYLDSRVEIVIAKIDDGWMRDSGPTFVKSGASVAAIDWVFNGWGNQGGWANWEHDDAVASFMYWAKCLCWWAAVHFGPLHGVPAHSEAQVVRATNKRAPAAGEISAA